MKWSWNENLRCYEVKKHNLCLTHRFLNNDGFVINSNTKNLKTNFKYLGEVEDFRRNERLLMAFDSKGLESIKKESKTEEEYMKKLYVAASKMMFKKNPLKSMENRVRSLNKIVFTETMLSKDGFMNIVNSERTNILDWDVDPSTKPIGTYIKYELYYR